MEAILMIKKREIVRKSAVMNLLSEQPEVISACPVMGEYDILAYVNGNRLHRLQRRLYINNEKLVESVGAIMPDERSKDDQKTRIADNKI